MSEDRQINIQQGRLWSYETAFTATVTGREHGEFQSLDVVFYPKGYLGSMTYVVARTDEEPRIHCPSGGFDVDAGVTRAEAARNLADTFKVAAEVADTINEQGLNHVFDVYYGTHPRA